MLTKAGGCGSNNGADAHTPRSVGVHPIAMLLSPGTPFCLGWRGKVLSTLEEGLTSLAHPPTSYPYIPAQNYGY